MTELCRVKHVHNASRCRVERSCFATVSKLVQHPVFWLQTYIHLLQRTQPLWHSCCLKLPNMNAVRITSTLVSQFLRTLLVCMESSQDRCSFKTF
jgi:hypothetical protein